MLITTTDFIPNMEIAEVKDSVFSEQVVSINVVKDMVNGIKGIFGGKFDSYSEEYKKARLLALEDLKAQAAALEGSAVINVKVQYNQFINSDIIFIAAAASGLAVTARSV